MRQRLASVFISYSSPTLTCLDALTFEPSNFTLLVSHATAASVLVLKRRMAQRYLSSLNFSFSAIITDSSTKLNSHPDNYRSDCLIGPFIYSAKYLWK